MCDTRVLDTGVVLGITIEKDQHHKECLKYAQSSKDTYIPPTAHAEYQNNEQQIRNALAKEIRDHRSKIEKEVSKGKLSHKDFKSIQSNILDQNDSERAYAVLHRHYTKCASRVRYDTIYKMEITKSLSDMEMEIYHDASKQIGGLGSVATQWSGSIQSYPSIESSLLINGNDKRICIEAHHIASQNGATELATTNYSDFIENHSNEQESRERNIVNCTKVSSVKDLCGPKFP